MENRKLELRRNNSKNLSKTFVNKEDVQRWARKQESKLDKGIFKDLTADTNILIKDLIKHYIEEIENQSTKGIELGTNTLSL
jgi:hypothetical protein